MLEPHTGDELPEKIECYGFGYLFQMNAIIRCKFILLLLLNHLSVIMLLLKRAAIWPPFLIRISS
jgi:hypothetical protein